jgi:hypothetical protein
MTLFYTIYIYIYIYYVFLLCFLTSMATEATFHGSRWVAAPPGKLPRDPGARARSPEPSPGRDMLRNTLGKRSMPWKKLEKFDVVNVNPGVLK